MSLRQQLETIYEKRGELTADIVVTEASKKTHPLHDRFEWDDKIAGHQYRLHQAGELIRKVKVVYREATEDEEGSSIRAWQSVRSEDGFKYVPSSEVAEDPLLTAMVLRDMEREWRTLHRRYGRFEEFVSLVRGDLEAA